MASLEGGQQLWLQKIVWFYKSLRENGPTAHLIYDPSKKISDGFTVSVASFKSYWIQHNLFLPFKAFVWHLFESGKKVREWRAANGSGRTNQSSYRKDLNHQYMLTLPV